MPTFIPPSLIQINFKLAAVRFLQSLPLFSISLRSVPVVFSCCNAANILRNTLLVVLQRQSVQHSRALSLENPNFKSIKVFLECKLNVLQYKNSKSFRNLILQFKLLHKTSRPFFVEGFIICLQCLEVDLYRIVGLQTDGMIYPKHGWLVVNEQQFKPIIICICYINCCIYWGLGTAVCFEPVYSAVWSQTDSYRVWWCLNQLKLWRALLRSGGRYRKHPGTADLRLRLTSKWRWIYVRSSTNLQWLKRLSGTTDRCQHQCSKSEFLLCGLSSSRPQQRRGGLQ